MQHLGLLAELANRIGEASSSCSEASYFGNTVFRGANVNSADQKVQFTLKVRRGVTGKASHD